MKIIGIIPARMESSRFPGKPLKLIDGMPMIGHVYHRAKMSGKLDAVYVATCNDEIFDYIQGIDGQAVMTLNTHDRCTDRTSEALLKIEKDLNTEFDIIVMIQGDEPLLSPQSIDDVLEPFESDPTLQVANLMGPLTEEELLDRNEIKVVVNRNNDALYFSREPIPTLCKGEKGNWNKQICVIPFRRNYLLKFSGMPEGKLEKAESIDMLRILEAGEVVKMVPTQETMYSVDTPEDLERVEKIMKNDRLRKRYS